MHAIYSKIVSILVAPFIIWGNILNPAPAPDLGVALPQAVGVFETSLAAPISSSATSMTLTANAIRGGGALSGYNCFTVDEGSAQAEVVCGTVSSTAVSGMSRGISYANGTSTVATNQFAHRRGANVKITDFPIIQILKAQNAGEDDFDAPIRYDSSVSTSTLALNTNNLVTAGYVAAAALNAGSVLTATETSGGFVELATGIEAASTTSSGSAGRLALSAAISTSSKPTSGSYVVVTDANGTINNFLASSTLANVTLSGTTTASGFTNIASTSIRFYTASSTWAKPANIKHIIVEAIGGGGGGGGANSGTTPDGVGGGGGGAGSYCKRILSAQDLVATSTIGFFIGSGGAGGVSTGGTGSAGTNTTFSSFATAGGGGGGVGSTAQTAAGGGGGTASGCTVNINGGGGGFGFGVDTQDYAAGGAGGNSFFGGGAASVTGQSTGNAAVSGGGGSGGSSTANSDQVGGRGGDGLIVITEVYF